MKINLQEQYLSVPQDSNASPLTSPQHGTEDQDVDNLKASLRRMISEHELLRRNQRRLESAVQGLESRIRALEAKDS